MGCSLIKKATPTSFWLSRLIMTFLCCYCCYVMLNILSRLGRGLSAKIWLLSVEYMLSFNPTRNWCARLPHKWWQSCSPPWTYIHCTCTVGLSRDSWAYSIGLLTWKRVRQCASRLACNLLYWPLTTAPLEYSPLHTAFICLPTCCVPCPSKPRLSSVSDQPHWAAMNTMLNLQSLMRLTSRILHSP